MSLPAQQTGNDLLRYGLTLFCSKHISNVSFYFGQTSEKDEP